MDAQTVGGGDRGLSEGRDRVDEWLAKERLSKLSVRPLKRRYWGGVFRVHTHSGAFVCKTGSRDFDASCEATMLQDLASAGLRVPRPIHAQPGLLVLESLNLSRLTPEVAEQAGLALAELHNSATAAAFGYRRGTTFGAIPLDNAWSKSWPDFFVDRRLLQFMTRARDTGGIGLDQVMAISTIAEALRDRLPSPARPALLHGDIWTNNVLIERDRPAFLDPSTLFGDPEFEVAFFVSYLDYRLRALRAYCRARPLSPSFWTVSLPAYRLAFDLAHVALFGARYAAQVDRSIMRVTMALGIPFSPSLKNRV